MNKVLAKIRFIKHSLPKAEAKVAEAILKNPKIIGDRSLSDFTRKIDSNDAAVIRFCKHLGYSGYTELKNLLLDSIKESEIVEIEEIIPTDSIFEVLRKVCSTNIQILNDTLALASNSYNFALHALMNTSNILFIGSGDAFIVCLQAYLKFSKLGIHCSANMDPVMQLTDAGNLGPGDIAFAVSYEGKSFSVNNALLVAKKRGATTICITSADRSPMLKYIDIVLYTTTIDFSISRDIVARRVADQMIIEGLYLTMLAKSQGKYDKKLSMMREVIDKNKG